MIPCQSDYLLRIIPGCNPTSDCTGEDEKELEDRIELIDLTKYDKELEGIKFKFHG